MTGFIESCGHNNEVTKEFKRGDATKKLHHSDTKAPLAGCSSTASSHAGGLEFGSSNVWARSEPDTTEPVQDITDLATSKADSAVPSGLAPQGDGMERARR